MKGTFAAEFARAAEASASNEPAWLQALRREAFDKYSALGFPTTKLEDWRFTNPAPILEHEYNTVDALPTFDASQVRASLLPALGDVQLVFVDGVFAPALSNTAGLPKGVALSTLRAAVNANPAVLSANLGKVADLSKYPFAALATALAHDGVFLHVPAGVAVEDTIQLLFVSTGASAVQTHSHNLFVFEASSQATLVERHVALSDHVYLNNILTEVRVAKNANVDHYVVQQDSEMAFRVANLALAQDRDSVFRSHAFDFGGRLVRNNLVGMLDGVACEAILNGLYFLHGRQHVDNFMWVEHMRENIPSHELYKGVLNDHATAVFTGRIYVHKEAQKTDAKQTNQNLLLSDDARVTTKPQLEIYADDVKCTHGATIGQLDQDALFYLRSRGVDRKIARDLLIHAFASDIVERIRPEVLREAVEAVLQAKMPDSF
jgi:Fe-S cluster assembly protein SufD